jgi:hypothetical protein
LKPLDLLTRKVEAAAACKHTRVPSDRNFLVPLPARRPSLRACSFRGLESPSALGLTIFFEGRLPMRARTTGSLVPEGSATWHWAALTAASAWARVCRPGALSCRVGYGKLVRRDRSAVRRLRARPASEAAGDSSPPGIRPGHGPRHGRSARSPMQAPVAQCRSSVATGTGSTPSDTGKPSSGRARTWSSGSSAQSGVSREHWQHCDASFGSTWRDKLRLKGAAFLVREGRCKGTRGHSESLAQANQRSRTS